MASASNGAGDAKKYAFSMGLLRIYVYKQAVTDIQGMDVIVNAANEQLKHVGGLSNHICKAAGQKMDDECKKYISKHGPLKVSDVFVSTAGKMACKAIFHAVGPRWRDYTLREDKCAEALHRTVYTCLEEIERKRWKRIALCAISSGTNGVPKKLCATMYIKAIEDFAANNPNSTLEVHFVFVNPRTMDRMIKAHKARLRNGRSPDFAEAIKFQSRQPQQPVPTGWRGGDTKPRYDLNSDNPPPYSLVADGQYNIPQSQ